MAPVPDPQSARSLVPHPCTTLRVTLTMKGWKDAFTETGCAPIGGRKAS